MKPRAHEYVNFQRKTPKGLQLISSIPLAELDQDVLPVLMYHRDTHELHDGDTLDYVFQGSVPPSALRYVWHKRKPTPPPEADEGTYDCYRLLNGWVEKHLLNPYVDPHKTRSKK